MFLALFASRKANLMTSTWLWSSRDLTLSDEKTAQRVAREIERRIEPKLELDVKILNSAPVAFKYGIIKNGSLLFSRNENKMIEYESGVISEYMDYKRGFSNRKFVKSLWDGK